MAAFAATTDNSVAVLFVKTPPIVPNGVRFAATMKIPEKKGFHIFIIFRFVFYFILFNSITFYI